MPFYQLVCIAAHYPKYEHIKDLVTRVATHVLDNGGVVRGLNSWGTRTLPQRMRGVNQFHTIGDYWTMQFDASPNTLRSLNKIMRHDPQVIRWTSLKVGEKLEDVVTLGEKTVMRI
ncbi:ribosomal protein S6 [Lentinus tigrinus ALCF2SS1-7]|uniref:Ribosomal protein S6 n=1 Tax=Lentinus tigrinus ALCF2SS1-6 TaxID=1328759 RepID=A0A5C2SL46_9APHY|nr:ribosomal protein S6 [Lentinus tigrinus ALCF2SS1-6]RPD78290.1 ribosomal protein S6 [Lentinus tigrinus ALCF2SS1-7]